MTRMPYRATANLANGPKLGDVVWIDPAVPVMQPFLDRGLLVPTELPVDAGDGREAPVMPRLRAVDRRHDRIDDDE